MPWGGAGRKNIEQLHTLVILSSFFFWLQMHFSFIGKAHSGELRSSATAFIGNQRPNCECILITASI